MNCTEARGELADYSGGFLAAKDRDRVQQHLTACASCREHLAQLRQLDALLAGDRQVAGESLVQTVMAQVRAADLQRMPTWIRLLQEAGPFVAALVVLEMLVLAVWERVGGQMGAAEVPDLVSALSLRPEWMILLPTVALFAGAAAWALARLGEALA